MDEQMELELGGIELKRQISHESIQEEEEKLQKEEEFFEVDEEEIE